MGCERKQKVYAKLAELGISYVRHQHPAVFTCDEADKYAEGIEGARCKNLFLRDGKGKRHYLVVLSDGKRVDLTELKEILGEKRIGFASERRLMERLGVESGSVSPFNLINDEENKVDVVIDGSLRNFEKVNFHPNDNTETLTISYEDLLKFLNKMDKRLFFY